MSRPVLALSLLVAFGGLAQAGDPKPIWELDVSGAKRNTGLGWLSFSPGGQALTAVVVQETVGESPRFHYQLRVWNAADRKERFSADLGFGRMPHWGDELASFPSPESILTGGPDLSVRNLENGQVLSTQMTAGLGDHTVWSVPDLQESFFLRRDPMRHGLPLELCYQSSGNNNDIYAARRGRFGVQLSEVAKVRPTREGAQADAVAMDPGRTRLVASFRDESSLDSPRHELVMYRVRTVEEFELQPLAQTPNPHGAPVSAMTFARNGRILLTGAEDGSVAIWNVGDSESWNEPRATLTGVSDHRVINLAVSYDWRLAAAITWDRAKPNLLLIDVDSGKLHRVLRLSGDLMAVAFSPDGQTLLTGNRLGKISAWDVQDLLKGK
jgi:hypothetical protein